MIARIDPPPSPLRSTRMRISHESERDTDTIEARECLGSACADLPSFSVPCTFCCGRSCRMTYLNPITIPGSFPLFPPVIL